MAGPIRPREVARAKAASIPEEVFEAFNELIAQGWNGRFANVRQKDAADRAVLKMKARDPSATRAALYDNGWMDVEDAYRKAGWKVEYDKPGYCEDYDAFFRFSK